MSSPDRGIPLSIAQLTAGANVSRQAVTKHLRVLEDAGLAHGERSGRENVFRLEPRRLRDARQQLEIISSQWDDALERLRRVRGVTRKMPTAGWTFGRYAGWMRRALCLSIALLPNVASAARPMVGADGGYGLAETTVAYRGTTSALELEGARVGGFGGVVLPLSESLAIVPRASLVYWRAGTYASSYGMGGGIPQDALHVFLPSLDVGLRFRPGQFFVDLGPRLGVMLVRGRAGSGSSEDSMISAAPVILARLEIGHRIVDLWDASLVGSGGANFGRYAAGDHDNKGLAEIALAVTRAL